MKKKILVPAVASLMLMSGVVGGSLAYLIDTTGPVKNTFTVGNVDITLEETGTTDGNGVATKNFKMVPGNSISKDPKVTVLADSEACWLFVEVIESDNLRDFIDYELNSSWIALDEEKQPGVYYREVEDAKENKEFSVLANDTVTVLTSVTKDMMDEVEKDNSKAPTLTFKAYAIQQANIDNVNEAWEQVSEGIKDPTETTANSEE